MDFLSDLSTVINTTTMAGSAGGIVRFLVMREHWKRLLHTSIAGGITALYTTPITVMIMLYYLDIQTIDPPFTYEILSANVAFLLGFLGTTLLMLVQDLIEKRAKKKMESFKDKQEDDHESYG